MKRISRRHALARIAAAPSLGILSGRARAAEFTYKYTNNQPVTHLMNIRAKEATDKIREEPNGRLDIQIFANNALGGDTDMVSQIRSGGIDFFTVSGLLIDSFVPVAAANGVGYYFSCAIGGVSPDVAMGRVWPYLGVLLIAVIVIAAVPWLSIGFL